MEDLFPKFIIETDPTLGDCLIMSKCKYHRDMATDKSLVKGGGWFIIKDGLVVFHGSSEDFGAAELEDIRKAVNSNKVFNSPTLCRNISARYTFAYRDQEELIVFSTLNTERPCL